MLPEAMVTYFKMKHNNSVSAHCKNDFFSVYHSRPVIEKGCAKMNKI